MQGGEGGRVLGSEAGHFEGPAVRAGDRLGLLLAVDDDGGLQVEFIVRVGCRRFDVDRDGLGFVQRDVAVGEDGLAVGPIARVAPQRLGRRRRQIEQVLLIQILPLRGSLNDVISARFS